MLVYWYNLIIQLDNKGPILLEKFSDLTKIDDQFCFSISSKD